MLTICQFGQSSVLSKRSCRQNSITFCVPSLCQQRPGEEKKHKKDDKGFIFSKKNAHLRYLRCKQFQLRSTC